MRHTSNASRTLLRISVLILCSLPMYSQTANTGAIAGSVSDPGGALVATAALVVKSQATQEERNINPVAINLLNAKNPDGTFVIPSPQTSRSGVNYTAVVPGHYNEDQFDTNLDLNLRSPDQLSVKFFFSNSNQDVPFFGASVPGFPALRSFGNRNLAIAETHIFSPRAINQFRFGFSRFAGQGVAGGTLTDQDVGINRFSDPQEEGIPQIDVLFKARGCAGERQCQWHDFSGWLGSGLGKQDSE